jgi:hypothetical protein
VKLIRNMCHLRDEEVDKAEAEAAEIISVGLQDGLAGGNHGSLIRGCGRAEGNVEGVDAALQFTDIAMLN